MSRWSANRETYFVFVWVLATNVVHNLEGSGRRLTDLFATRANIAEVIR